MTYQAFSKKFLMVVSTILVPFSWALDQHCLGNSRVSSNLFMALAAQLNLLQEDGLDIAPLGAGINTFTIDPVTLKEPALANSTLGYTTSRTKARGGCSWQILDTTEAVKLEITSTMRSITNTSANRSAIPRHLYSLSLEQQTIFIVLQWSSDLIETGLNLDNQNVTQVVRDYTTLSQLAPQECSTVVKAAESLKWNPTQKAVDGKEQLVQSMGSLGASTQFSLLAVSKLTSWKFYLVDRFQMLLNILSEEEKEHFLASIRNAIIAMPEEDMGQQSSTMGPFDVTAYAKYLSAEAHEVPFIAALGQHFIESYTEKASLTAVWRLQLAKSNKEEFYALRVLLQKYFLSPKSVNEVCNFLGNPKNSFQDIESIPSVTVSIFGYHDEVTKELVDLNNKHPSAARNYLNQDSLLRNKNRVTITMRPWQGLRVKGFEPPEKIFAKDIAPVAPEEFLVLNVQKAERLLLLLKIYSNDPDRNINPENLKHHGTRLDQILHSSSLDKETGKLTQDSKSLLIQLIRDLEKALPSSDPEAAILEDSGSIVGT